MSILDYADNPKYAMVSVAYSGDDVVFLYKVAPEKVIDALDAVIELLSKERERQKAAVVTHDYPGPIKENP